MRKKILSISIIASSLLFGTFHIYSQETGETPQKYNLPYKNTYVKEALVTENEYRIAKPEEIAPKSFEEAKNILPNPIWTGHEKELEMYWKAWQIAISNIRQPQKGSGFVSSYLDTAYNGNIFMWDSSFMMMFARYGYRFFPFQHTLDNFYAKQHPDGFICREIKADGADCFERYDPVSTGPNLLPWSEILYYKQYGDNERLNKIFPALCAYYKWLKLNRTWPNGTYWSSGWGTGMDNMPRVQPQYSMIYSHGHMVWLDACLQQILMANILLEIGFYLERWQEIEEFEDEIKVLTKYVHDNLWDEKTGYLYDQYADGSLNTTKGIGAFWALHTDVLDKTQLDRMVTELENTKTFNRPHRVPSLSADNPKYNPKGRYWQGGVWPGTNYMVITGLDKKGYTGQAKEIAKNHYNNVFEVYKNTGTFWEYYAPEAAEPGFMARKDFVGWAGLPPIAIFIEYILGIRSDYANRSLIWDITQTEAHGIERYPFGPDGLVTLKVNKRNSQEDTPSVTIETNVPFELTLYWGKDKSKKVSIKEDKQTL
ncbi:glycoside hydrolase [Dysgonomonas sp. GY75]|uniref:MGH1-like glycoside hydrolase domain-containing protein n=1 Tax=Dysgonomonas sp. GY75 TaxID=2780419 RepID=UPI0018844E2D|nr:trehalase family glycosidase [Dysgonomonas sp. GY75]MBF0647712.1 glycoside hydrolase [Dysgonomonas sp. GY75]